MDESIARSAVSRPLGRLRLSDQPRRLLVQMLDAKAAAASKGAETRREPRYPYLTREGVLLTIHHVGGNWERYRVWPRNISRNGLGFFHGSFLHTGSYCLFNLQTCDGQIVPHEGHVVHCRFIVREIHEIGVKFVEPLDLKRFVHELADAGDAQFIGRVLIVDDAADDRQRLKRFAQQMGVEVTEAEDAPEAIDLALSGQFDLMIVAPTLPAMSREEMIEILHEDGYAGTLIKWGGSGAEDDQSLPRPCALKDLCTLFTEHLIARNTD